MSAPRALLALTAAVVGAASSPAQNTNRFPVTESYDPVSNMVGFVASDIVVVNSSQMGGGGLQWTAADLGIPAGSNIDAFSDGADIIPFPGPAISVPSTCRLVFVEYTVDPASTGAPGSIVEAEATTDGAASDTVGVTITGGAFSYELMSDALTVAPLPAETDLDALAWREKERYPVFFSLDAPSAAALTAAGVPAAANDVLVSVAKGAPPAVLFPGAMLGLSPGDDIDGLAVHAPFGTLPATPVGSVVFSLSRTSTSVLASAAMPSALYTAGLTPWMSPAQLTLEPLDDDLNGVRITDPITEPCCYGSELGGVLDTFFVEGSRGGRAGRVEVQQGSNFVIEPAPPQGGSPWAIWIMGDIPCTAMGLGVPPTISCWAVNPVFGVFGTAGVGPAALVVPPQSPKDLSFQGLYLDPVTFEIHTTNLVTARVF